MYNNYHFPSEFYNELALLVQSKLPLPESLRSLEKSIRKRRTRKVLGKLSMSVEKGHSLSRAMYDQKETFPIHYQAIIEAGEKDNLLAEALHEVARQARFSERMLEALKTASLYPLLILLIGFLLYGFILYSVTPGFAELYKELLFGYKLPTLTQAVVFQSKIVCAHIYLVSSLFFVIVLLIAYLFTSQAAVPILMRLLKITPPYFIVFRNLDMAKFCGLWSIMMQQKTPAPKALRIVAGMSEGYLSRALYHAAKSCEGGCPPAEALEKISSVSGMVVSAMRHIPDEKQSDEFEKMSEHFEGCAADSAVKVGIIMEVLITIACAFIAGTIISAMFIPLIKIIEKLA